MLIFSIEISNRFFILYTNNTNRNYRKSNHINNNNLTTRPCLRVICQNINLMPDVEQILEARIDYFKRLFYFYIYTFFSKCACCFLYFFLLFLLCDFLLLLFLKCTAYKKLFVCLIY